MQENDMKVLLISDKPRWAYACIAEALIKQNSVPSLRLDHISCKGRYDQIAKIHKQSPYDCYFVLGWQNWARLSFLPLDRTISGVHSHQSFDGKETLPNKDILPCEKAIHCMKTFTRLNTVSRRLQNILREAGIQAEYTPNGVDSDEFAPADRDFDRFVVGAAAARKNDWNKGVEKIIKPACKSAGVEMKNVGMGTTYLDHADMPSFYNACDCYVCASKSEGMSLSVLEAASCGCIIISTRCGDIEELIVDGENGLLIDRSKEDLQEKLIYLKDNKDERIRLSKSIRESVVSSWDWRVKSEKWFNFIVGAA